MVEAGALPGIVIDAADAVLGRSRADDRRHASIASPVTLSDWGWSTVSCDIRSVPRYRAGLVGAP